MFRHILIAQDDTDLYSMIHPKAELRHRELREANFYEEGQYVHFYRWRSRGLELGGGACRWHDHRRASEIRRIGRATPTTRVRNTRNTKSKVTKRTISLCIRVRRSETCAPPMNGKSAVFNESAMDRKSICAEAILSTGSAVHRGEQRRHDLFLESGGRANFRSCQRRRRGSIRWISSSRSGCDSDTGTVIAKS